MRYLGIDYGTKKIGLALSDEAGTMGFPHGVIQNDKGLFVSVAALIDAHGVGAVVIGAPLQKEQEGSELFSKARSLGEDLATLGLQVFYEPEAFTTQEARRDIEGNRTNKGNVDASAAALILTSYLSHAHDNN